MKTIKVITFIIFVGLSFNSFATGGKREPPVTSSVVEVIKSWFTSS